MVPNSLPHNHHHFHFPLRRKIHFNMLHTHTWVWRLRWLAILHSIFHSFASNCRKCAKIQQQKMCASISPHPTYDGNRATGNRSIDEQLKKSWYFHKYLTPNIVHTFAEATTPVDAFSDDNIFKKCSFVRSAYHRISLQFCSLNWTSWENGVVLLLLVRLSRTHVRGKDDVRSILLISRAPAH